MSVNEYTRRGIAPVYSGGARETFVTGVRAKGSRVCGHEGGAKFAAKRVVSFASAESNSLVVARASGRDTCRRA